MRLDRQQRLVGDMQASRQRWTIPEIDAELKRRGIGDVEERISLKHDMEARGMITDEVLTRGRMRSDVYAPGQGGPAPTVSPISEAQRRLLARAGIRLDARIDIKLLDMLLKSLALEPEQRIALKAAMAEAGMLLEGAEASVTSPRAPARTTMQASSGKPIKGCKMQIACGDWDRLR